MNSDILSYYRNLQYWVALEALDCYIHNSECGSGGHLDFDCIFTDTCAVPNFVEVCSYYLNLNIMVQ